MLGADQAPRVQSRTGEAAGGPGGPPACSPVVCRLLEGSAQRGRWWVGHIPWKPGHHGTGWDSNRVSLTLRAVLLPLAGTR